MNLPPIDAPALLREHRLHPDKALGQNFLQQPAALEAIIAAAEIQPQDVILEIGPGLGSLTRYLALSAKSVTCVELDARLIPVLQAVLKPYPNTHIVCADILQVSAAHLMQTDDYLVVANVPYYITSAIFRHLLHSAPRPKRVVLTIQKEVAERICAKPGDMSLLSLSVQIYGQPKIVSILPAEAFFPEPKVDSAVIRVDMYAEARLPEALVETFFRMAKAGFSQKRKTLRNSLSAGLRLSVSETSQLLENAAIDPMRRAESLSIDEWAVLTRLYAQPAS